MRDGEYELGKFPYMKSWEYNRNTVGMQGYGAVSHGKIWKRCPPHLTKWGVMHTEALLNKRTSQWVYLRQSRRDFSASGENRITGLKWFMEKVCETWLPAKSDLRSWRCCATSCGIFGELGYELTFHLCLMSMHITEWLIYQVLCKAQWEDILLVC